MRDKRKKILEDPREYLRKQMEIPEDLDELPEEEREEYIEEIENAAISFDPTTDVIRVTNAGPSDAAASRSTRTGRSR